jgi:purine-cytosine permease-like protein
MILSDTFNLVNHQIQTHHPETPSNQVIPDPITIELAAHDVRSVLDQQREQSQSLTTKLNILFVVNGALLTLWTLSKVIYVHGFFSIIEILGFLLNFALLIDAFLPRQVAVTPNLEDNKFLERYLTLTPEEYQLRMMVNLSQTYNTNKQRIDDISQSLTYAAYVTWSLAFIIMLHIIAAYVLPGN